MSQDAVMIQDLDLAGGENARLQQKLAYLQGSTYLFHYVIYTLLFS